MMADKQLEIYKITSGEVVFDIDAEQETIWATIDQIAKLFDVTRRSIEIHLSNIYNDGELKEKRTAKENFAVRIEGTRRVRRKVKFYNLDAIISVGYRVNSKKATDFRIWATQTLKQYIVNGVAVNERRLEQLDAKRLKDVEHMMNVVRRLIWRQELDAGEANGVLEVITQYMASFEALKEFDDGRIDLTGLNKTKKKQRTLSLEMCDGLVEELKIKVKGGDLFGKMRGKNFEGTLSAVAQTFGGKDLYPTVAEKAANLLYLVIKDHPFYDGNKRIGALLFIVFLTLNDCHLTKNGETKISDKALTAIALLIAESKPAEKELIVALVCKLLEG